MSKSDFEQGSFKAYRAVKTVHLGKGSGLGRNVLKDDVVLFDGTTVVLVFAGGFPAGINSPGGDRLRMPHFQGLIDIGCFVPEPNFNVGIEISDEGVILSGEIEQINFKGTNVTATLQGGDPEIADVTVTGGGGGGGGTTISLIAGENLLLGDVVALNDSGEGVKAGASFPADKYRVVGISSAAYLAGATATVIVVGFAPTLFSGAPPASENSQYVFLDTTLGVASLVPPLTGNNTRFIVGVLQGADGVTLTPIVIFQPQYVSRRF